VRPAALATLIALLLLALPASAGADSILFVRDGDVWISTPDGTTERPLTAGGGYASPSMADDGTIVALRGSSFARLRPDGAAIGAPVQAVGGDWLVASGPYDARVSPDGLKIAYWFSGRRRLCLPIEPSCSLQDSEVAAYAHAGRVTDPLELGAVRERREPSWYGSGRALLFRHGGGTGETVAVNRVGRGESDLQGWFSYDDGTALDQGQLSRAGDRLAAVVGGDEIHLFGVGAPPPALPVLRCVVPGGPFSSPTWSPDGSMLAWEARDGVHVAGPVPDLRAPVPDCSVIRERRLAAGTDPYWGAADVPGAASGPATGGSQPAGRRPARAFRSLRVARRQRGRAVRLRLRITRGPARVDARLRRGGRRAGRVLRRRAKAGTLRLRIPLNRAARRALARRGRLSLRLTVSVRAPGRASATARRRVSLRSPTS
jgi:WD40-like Beta Propeller Repeat